MTDRVQTLILSNLLASEDFVRTVIPHLKDAYFGGEDEVSRVEKALFTTIEDHFLKYNQVPTSDAILINLSDNPKISDDVLKGARDYINLFETDPHKNQQWLIDKTEEFCKDAAVDLALLEAIKIRSGQSKDREKGEIPKILEDALGVSFDNHIGHEYLERAEDRYRMYTEPVKKYVLDLAILNKITKNGVPPKTLNIIMAGVNVGKTLALCHLAAAHMMMGLNVLYISMETAEELISQRIDANLLGIDIDMLEKIDQPTFMKKFKAMKDYCHGRLIVKEFPTGAAHVNHFRHVIREAKMKKNFVPDIIMIDYLNICASSRMKMGGSVNSYTLVKSIAEEIRALAVEMNVPIWSATQVNREGFASTDVDMDSVSESWGLPATADFMIALMQTDEMAKLNQYLGKQLKNRYRDKNKDRRFVIGVNKAQMKLYDVEQCAGEDIVDDEPVVQDKPKTQDKKSKFKSFKFKGDEQDSDEVPW